MSKRSPVVPTPRRGTLRWFVGIPIGTNPLILMDTASVLVVAWCVMAVILLVLQLWFGGYLNASHLRGAAWVSGYVTLVFAGIFVLTAFVVQRNRYAALYRFEEKEAYCENLRVRPHPVVPSRLPRWRGYAVDPPLNPLRSVIRRAAWADVTSVTAIPELRVLLLRGGRGVLLRVYCPDDEVFRGAREYVRTRLRPEVADGISLERGDGNAGLGRS